MTENLNNHNDQNDQIIEELTDIYYLMQYGKLMPGFIHNINGKLTSLDSKIQLTNMKLQMKVKKLAQNTEYSDEIKTVLNKEYSDLATMFEALNNSKNELNSLLSILNSKASSESVHTITMIDLNSAIKDFHDFFKFYKHYKHNVEINFDLDGSPFVKMQYKDFFFLLYVIARNSVDAMYESDNKENFIHYATKNFDHHVELTITNNGVPIPADKDIFAPLNTDKAKFGNEESSDEAPMGIGLDLFFLKRMLTKYAELSYSWQSDEKETTFKFVIPKK